MGVIRQRFAQIVVPCIALLLLGALGLSRTIEKIELHMLDSLFELRGPLKYPGDIVLATIDGATVQELGGRWPLPRGVYARLLRQLASASPLVIGIDIVFAGPSVYGPADDEALRAAILDAKNVVLAESWLPVPEMAYTKIVLVQPYVDIASAARAVGLVDNPIDIDGVVRRTWAQRTRGQHQEFSFGWRVAALSGTHGYGDLPGHLINADALKGSNLVINFRGRPGSFPTVPIYRILANMVSPEIFRNKIVLIGVTDPMAHDATFSPFARGGDMPGVEVQANAAATLLAGDYIRETPRPVRVLIALIAGVLSYALVSRWSHLGLIGASASLVTAVAATVMLFAVNVWFPPVFVCTTITTMTMLRIITCGVRAMERE